MFKYFFSLFFCCFLFGLASAQTASIRGFVYDSDSQAPLEYASVVLSLTEDSTLISGVVTSVDGSFLIPDIQEGDYYLQVQFVGYASLRLPDFKLTQAQEYNVGKVLLKINDQLLNEIAVTGRKVSAYHKIDRQVYRAEQYQVASGGTATDVLRNVPAVAVNANGEITVRGTSGFTILLNGVPVQSDPATILNQLPANAIENVEIVTAPSAKYDPEGKAGIINIITKKGAADGLFAQVNVRLGAPSIERYGNAAYAPRYGGDISLNYRKDRWDISLGTSYLRNDIAGRRVGDVYTIISDTLTRFPSEGERSFDEINYTARATVSYTATKSDKFDLGFYAGRRTKERTADILYKNSKVDLSEADTVGQITYFNENLRIRRGDFLLSSLGYSRTFTDQSELAGSLLYEYTMLGGPTTNLNLSWPSLTDTLQDQYNTNNNPLHGIRLQLDYSRPVGSGKLETGYQFRHLDHKGNFFYEERIPGTRQYALIPEFSSRVDLIRTIHSVYGQYTNKQDKLTYTAGLRAELMGRQLVLTNNQLDETYDYDFIQLYPAANVLYDWSDAFRLKAAYSRRVERTTTFKMNPFPEREHSETLEQGDAELLPEFIDLAEVSIVKDFGSNSLFATAYYRGVQNLINRVNTVYNDSILNRIYSNVGQGRSLGLEAGLELNPTQWWQLFAGGNLYNYRIEGSFAGEPVDTRSWIYSVNANTTFQIGPTFNVQWTLNYISDRNTAQGEDSRFLSPNLTVQKTFFNQRLTATLQWLNMDMGLLPTNEQRITTMRGGNSELPLPIGSNSQNNGFFTTTNYIYEVDVVMLNLSYRINQVERESKFIKSEFGNQEF